MKKSVYSLVLSDGVVEEIDRLAYEMHTNRSQLVNRILAEYVSYVTPEKRFNDIFERVNMILRELNAFQSLPKPSDTVMAIRSALGYKYNPTVKYSIELYREDTPYLGELRVSLRTQNAALVGYLDRFYRVFCDIEAALTGRSDVFFEGGRFLRKLRLRTNAASYNAVSSNTLGEVIAAYIRLFDDALKIWFASLDYPSIAAVKIESLYRTYLSKAQEII